MTLLARLRARLGFGTPPPEPPPPPVDLDAQLARVRAAEAGGPPPLGRLIHRFDVDGFELRLDRDVTGAYRITVGEGAERRYSFTLRCPPGDYAALHDAYAEVVRFLRSDRLLVRLPNDDRLRGHYYGS